MSTKKATKADELLFVWGTRDDLSDAFLTQPEALASAAEELEIGSKIDLYRLEFVGTYEAVIKMESRS